MNLLSPALLPGLLLLTTSVCAFELPEGEGKALIEGHCVGCHRVDYVERALGYDAPGWKALIATMIQLDGTVADTVAAYLAEHFPPNERRAPVYVDGPFELELQAWVTPTLGQRTRDPVEAPDGSIWWAGQGGDRIGRLDPVTGVMKEFELPPGSKPHSVNAAADGAIWYTGNGNGTLGRLDPGTGEIEVFPLPDPKAVDPHTAEFDEKGRLWFTVQRGNRVGRLDPATGDTVIVELDRPRSRPYGLKLAADGFVWVACNGGPCLYRLHPETLAQKRIRLPNAESHVRRLAIAPDGSVWYVNSGAGRLGRYRPETDEITEWPSPSGPLSHPYAMAWADGAVWYNESGRRPDMLVRFDPDTERFQSWPIPSGDVYAGILRHMRVTRGGDLLLHQSATNHLLRVRLRGGGS